MDKIEQNFWGQGRVSQVIKVFLSYILYNFKTNYLISYRNKTLRNVFTCKISYQICV